MNRLSHCLTALALSLALPLPACSTPSEAAPAPRHDKLARDCVAVMTRARTCTAQFVPALVDARARLDVPAGIAARVQADRAGVIAEAKVEWQADSTDAALAATCADLAAKAPPKVEQARACLATQDCGPFVACLMPVIEQQLRAGR